MTPATPRARPRSDSTAGEHAPQASTGRRRDAPGLTASQAIVPPHGRRSHRWLYRLARLAGALALLLCGPASAQLPGLGDGTRGTVDSAVAPWSSLVRVQVPGMARCTGFLVAPDRVATAAHCLYSTRLGRFIPPGSVHVLLGYHGGGYDGHGVGATYATADGFDPRRPAETRGADVALVTLAAPLAGPVLATGAERHGRAVLGGYQQDRAEVVAADLDCRIEGSARDGGGRRLLVHDCAATRGSSGAPVLVRAADGAWRVIGVHVASHRHATGGVAVPVAGFRDLLDRRAVRPEVRSR